MIVYPFETLSKKASDSSLLAIHSLPPKPWSLINVSEHGTSAIDSLDKPYGKILISLYESKH